MENKDYNMLLSMEVGNASTGTGRVSMQLIADSVDELGEGIEDFVEAFNDEVADELRRHYKEEIGED